MKKISIFQAALTSVHLICSGSSILAAIYNAFAMRKLINDAISVGMTKAEIQAVFERFRV